MSLVLRTRGAPATASAAVRQEVRATNSEQPVYDLAPLADQGDAQLLRPAATARRLAAFALLARVLAGVGVYGVRAYVVGQRTREPGIHLALGAHPRQLLAMVMGQGLRLTLLGVGFGLLAALLCTRWMTRLVYGADAREPGLFVVVAAALADEDVKRPDVPGPSACEWGSSAPAREGCHREACGCHTPLRASIHPPSG